MKKYTDTGKKDTRSGFGAGLAELLLPSLQDVCMTKYDNRLLIQIKM